jgi:hypothetical protein
VKRRTGEYGNHIQLYPDATVPPYSFFFMSILPVLRFKSVIIGLFDPYLSGTSSQHSCLSFGSFPWRW